jgi:hypothetical protein
VRTSDLLAGAAGAAAAAGTLAAIGPLDERPRGLTAAAGLVVAAAIYPAARTRWAPDAAAARELAAVAGYGALAVAAARRSSRSLRLAMAAGWASHAAFDAVHHAGDGSRIPGWYPAMCAGYDLVLAAGLART